MPSSAAAFRIFGFPVYVRSGFLVFMALVIFIQGWQFGLPFAGFLAAFTLLHELGHAFAARATGAEAEISLDFMAGYASFTPTRPLARWERAGISFAGPGIQILVGTIVYLAVRGGLARPEYGDHIAFAVLIAGPVMGGLNLMPLLPFDGGNIAEVAVELFSPRHARRIMQWFTIALTVAAFVFMATHQQYLNYALFAFIPFVSVLATMQADRNRVQARADQRTLARAEAFAWATGQLRFPHGALPSPWFLAWQRLQDGEPGVARQMLLADLDDPRPVRWMPPDAAPRDTLRQLIALLPRPLPVGQMFSSFVLSAVLLKVGDYYDDAHYAAAAYAQHGAPMFAVHVARSAAALGDRDTALAWLRTAARTAPPDVLAVAVQTAAEFDSLRTDPAFSAAVAQ